MKKTLAALAAVTLSLGVLAWGAYAALQRRFYAEPQLPAFPAARDRAEAVRQDLEVLALLPTLDRGFPTGALDAFEAGRGKLLEAAATISPAAFEMNVSRLVALGDNGHTTVGRRLRRLHRVPVRFGWFEEGLYVVRTSDAHANLLGGQVLAINGKPPGELLAALAPYVSGPKEHARDTSPTFLESPTALAGMWPGMSDAQLQLQVRTLDGSSVTETLDAAAPDPQARYTAPARNLAPQRIATENEPWRSLLAGRAELPLVLREPDASLYVASLDDGKGLYLHINQVTGDERGALADQLRSVTDARAPKSLHYAILDLRFNGGGDYTETLRFTKELPKRVADDGRLFILTDHATFSAALVTLARAKHFAGSRAVILGERAGDRERFWAESGKPLELPNSKIMVFYATGYHDWNEGCGVKDWARCYWLNWAFDVPAGDLAPKSPMAWRFADYREGGDTVLQEALRLARR